jgi:epoxyqueuosine reductase
MFYMATDDLWRWKMNVARAMGNTRDRRYVTDLIQAFETNDDHRVQAMTVWALGRIGDETALKALRELALRCKDVMLEEVNLALEDSVRAIT